ncbi:MAG: helix-turn-helix domain-containing protein [Chloroflexi bacterium]|nr:helix-turn-helix domain-containing protein [Chloroflexota bacterium]
MPTSAVKRRTSADPKPQWDAAKVKALRFYMGLTQQMFAKRLGVRQQTVSEWEKGIYRPRGATVTLLTMIGEQVGFKYEGDKK